MEIVKNNQSIKDGLRDERPVLNLDELRKNPSTIPTHLDSIVDSLSRSYIKGDFSNKPVIEGEILSGIESENYYRAQSEGLPGNPADYSICGDLMKSIDSRAKKEEKRIEGFESNKRNISLVSGTTAGVGALMGSYESVGNMYQVFENQIPVLEYLPNVFALGTTLGLCAVAGYVAKEISESLYQSSRASSRDQTLAQYTALHATAHELASNLINHRQKNSTRPVLFNKREEFGNPEILNGEKIFKRWWSNP